MEEKETMILKNQYIRLPWLRMEKVNQENVVKNDVIFKSVDKGRNLFCREGSSEREYFTEKECSILNE